MLNLHQIPLWYHSTTEDKLPTHFKDVCPHQHSLHCYHCNFGGGWSLKNTKHYTDFICEPMRRPIRCDWPSMSSQWPVRTQKHTMTNDKQKERISAGVKRPQHPNEILKQGKCQTTTTWRCCMNTINVCTESVFTICTSRTFPAHKRQPSTFHYGNKKNTTLTISGIYFQFWTKCMLLRRMHLCDFFLVLLSIAGFLYKIMCFK